MDLALASRDDNRVSLDGATLSHFFSRPRNMYFILEMGGGGGGVWVGFCFFFSPQTILFFP